MNHELDEPGFIALPKTSVGLESIADIYISEIDLSASVTPSDLFIAMSSTEEVSANTKCILREVFHLNEGQIPA